MAKLLYVLAMLIFALIVVWAFFQPWVRIGTLDNADIEIPDIGIAKAHIPKIRFAKIPRVIIDQEEVFGRSISGYDIPVLANRPDGRSMISIIKIFKPQLTDADKKSYLVWGLPGLAAVIFLLSLIFARNKWVNLIIGFIGVAIFVIAAYKITTADLNKFMITIHIGPGLWFTLSGYLGMGAASLMNLFYLILRGRRSSK